MSERLSYKLFAFDELSLQDLYEVLQLRIEVFVVEQDCPYQDADGKDQISFHLLGRDREGKLQVYTRLVPKGVSYQNYTAIGRVITSIEMRRSGAGIELMKKSVEETLRLWPNESIKLSAQSHLEGFYNKFGFVAIGEGYLEDGIPHIGMVRK